MSERNIAAMRQLMEEGFSAGNVDVCDELVAADAIEHQRGLKPGIEGAKATIHTLHTWFADFKIEIVDLVANDDTVWIRCRATGTDTGGVFGRPPTGKPFEITVFDVARFVDGKMVEHWGVPDQLGLLAQLGHFGRPEPSAVGSGAPVPA